MPAFSRFTGRSRGFEFEFVEREMTPRPLMKLNIYLYKLELYLSYTVSVLDRFGVDHGRTTVHNWIRKANLQLADGTSPNHVALDETVIQLPNEGFWLLAAIDPETNEFLQVRIHPVCTIALTERFLRDLREKHDVADALFLVDGARWLQAALHCYDLRFQQAIHGNRNAIQ